MRLSNLFPLLLLVVSVTAQPVNLLLDFETSTAGTTLTTAIATNSAKGDHKGFSISPNTVANFKALVISGSNYSGGITALTVSNVTYGSGSRGLLVDYSSMTNYESLSIFLPGGTDTTITNVSIVANMVLRSHNPQDGDRSIDHIVMYASSGGYCVVQESVTPGELHVIRAHADNGGTTFGSNISVETNVEYRVTAKRNVTAGTCDCEVYNAQTGALVGTSSAAMTASGNTYQVLVGDNIFYGIGAGLEGTTYWDNIGLDWTNATFPLINSTTLRTVTATRGIGGTIRTP